MKQTNTILFPLVALAIIFFSFTISSSELNKDIISYEVDPQSQNLALYWKNENGKILRNFSALKEHTESNGEELIFAANAGMYQENQTPLGLYIEKGKTLHKINKRKNAYGNFYLQPNGVFFLTKDKKASICKTDDFSHASNIQFATQSGPMLLIDGDIHPKLTKGSKNLNIRNGVGILPDGKVLFAMSKKRINFYDFATYFKNQGCANALYLDGFVSKVYLPSKDWIQLKGNFGVMIGVTVPEKN